ncbi:MAG: hypothetical protein WC852_07395 [Candidatus Nanoarchaeia archaeon]|jgi:uncharacterized iron-regulated protein
MTIEDKLKSARYYLIGEIHGTAEAPIACMNIMKKYHIKKLALELDKSKQPEINEYYAGEKSLEDITLFHNPPSHDGRASLAVKNLLRDAKKNGLKVYLVDDADNPLERDKRMAENLMNIGGKVAFLCGNIHASKEPIKIPKAVLLLTKFIRKLKLGKLILPDDGIIRTAALSFLMKKRLLLMLFQRKAGSIITLKSVP